VITRRGQVPRFTPLTTSRIEPLNGGDVLQRIGSPRRYAADGVDAKTDNNRGVPASPVNQRINRRPLIS